MKPFDIELAKQGYPVCTRDGRPVKILDFDFNHAVYPIVAKICNKGYDMLLTYSKEGFLNNSTETYKDDLFMASAKKEGWINIYNRLDGKVTGHCIYSSEEEARKNIFGSKDEHLATIKIEWEE